MNDSKDAKSLLEELHRREIEGQIIGKDPMSLGEQQSNIRDILEADKRRKSEAIQPIELRKIEETKRYPFFSQLNALFTKHNLEWVRTPFQSFYEFLFPLLLFSMAAGIRRAIPIETTDWTLDSFK